MDGKELRRIRKKLKVSYQPKFAEYITMHHKYNLGLKSYLEYNKFKNKDLILVEYRIYT